MVKFAVCDDEREMTDYISDRLREYYPEDCEIRKYGDGEMLSAQIGAVHEESWAYIFYLTSKGK